MGFRVAVAVLLLGAVSTQAPAQPAGRLDLFASLVDGYGAPAAGVEPGDLDVSEDGVEARVIGVEAIRWPLKVQLLADNGVGLESENLMHLRNGVRGLFEALPASAEVTFVTTAPQPRFLLRGARARDALFESIGRLAPDGSSGRFLDSLNEAADRIERDRSDHFTVIIAVGTTVGDTDVRERDVERLMARLQALPITVHVVLYGSVRRRLSAGLNQAQLGTLAADATGGRYERIAAASRLGTLLPEIGEHVTKSYLDGRYRITIERPPRASGVPGDIQLSTRGRLTITDLSFDARLP